MENPFESIEASSENRESPSSHLKLLSEAFPPPAPLTANANEFLAHALDGGVQMGLVSGSVGGLATQVRFSHLMTDAAQTYRQSSFPMRQQALADYQAAESLAGSPLSTMLKGAAKGFLAAELDSGIDFVLQKTIGDKVVAMDAFKPTIIEQGVIALSASLPVEFRTRLVLAGAGWVEGRIENVLSR